MRTRASGASPTMKKINQTTVKRIPFPDLGVDDQRRIVENIIPCSIELERARNILHEARELVARFDRSLLRKLDPGG